MSPRLVLSCEHATWAVPPHVDLGLVPEQLLEHHAWDSGALELAQALSLGTGVPVFAGQVTRLVVDLNRHEGGAEVVPTVAFGLDVPGNVGLTPEERERRLATYHRPHRRAVQSAAEQVLAGGPCLHLSLHSFVPVLHGVRRDVEVGVLFDPARAFEASCAEALLQALETRGWDARANQPYLGTDDGITTWLRGELDDPRYAGIEIEASQALLHAGRLPSLAADLLRAVEELLAELG
ncbi:MAG: N-formylglutamate amidohydrolase [Planctomycetota bacterium]